MSQITIDIPEETLRALKIAPGDAADALRMAAAVKLYELGRLSSGAAAALAGVPRVVFLAKLADYGVDALDLTEEQLASFKKIPCAILKVDKENTRHAERVIMGIRHITGPREWGAYQHAQLIQQLHDEENHAAPE